MITIKLSTPFLECIAIIIIVIIIIVLIFVMSIIIIAVVIIVINIYNTVITYTPRDYEFRSCNKNFKWIDNNVRVMLPLLMKKTDSEKKAYTVLRSIGNV